MPVSYIGINPYIKFQKGKPDNPLGSEPVVMKILAEKFGFVAKFVPQKAFADMDNAVSSKFYVDGISQSITYGKDLL